MVIFLHVSSFVNILQFEKKKSKKLVAVYLFNVLEGCKAHQFHVYMFLSLFETLVMKVKKEMYICNLSNWYIHTLTMYSEWLKFMATPLETTMYFKPTLHWKLKLICFMNPCLSMTDHPITYFYPASHTTSDGSFNNCFGLYFVTGIGVELGL